MKPRHWISLLVVLILVGCNQTVTPVPTASLTPTRTLPGVTPQVTSAPDVKSAARAYLDAWRVGDFPAMYAMLTSISRDAITQEEFTDHYQSINIEAALNGVDYEIMQSLIETDAAQVGYRLTLRSSLFGDIPSETSMNLSLEDGSWRVQWADTLVLPQLAGGNYIKRDISVPARANIYDRSGKALAAQTDATAVGIYPGQIIEGQEAAVYSAASRLTGLRPDTISYKVEQARLFGDWYVQLGEVPTDRIAQMASSMNYSGLVLTSANWRFYYEGGVAPHLVGYVAPIQAGEEAERYQQMGYSIDERIGRIGIEAWGEEYLGGQRGGSLFVFNSSGQVVQKLAEVPVEAGQAIYTTIDRDFQLALQKSMQGFRGAIVVLERDTGRVLAMVSSPGFDPNAYEPANFNFDTILSEIYNDLDGPYIDRAAAGQYPLGSVFKIITMAAALESGDYTTESRLDCGYFFEELPGITLTDWTYERFLENGTTQPSGNLSLSQGLIRSCNPWFYHIGLDFFQRGRGNLIADMALGFGLGEKTGIEVVEESAGNVPYPRENIDATNLAIGQGDFLTTPLQVADFVAAVGNGGTLFVPQAIEKIVPPVGDPTFVFSPTVRGTLPISAASLASIQQAMIGVVESTDPVGTAQRVFVGLPIKVAGKTGTAQTGFDPHAWFAGYTYQERPDKPDIAIAVLVENVGEGSTYAAPIFRRVVELYFTGSPQRLFPWESTYYVTRTPTPTEGPTSTPGPTETESPTETPGPTEEIPPTDEPTPETPQVTP